MNTAINDLPLDDMPLDLPPALVFTDAAARKVSSLIENEGNTQLMLRVFVQGGGCSGMQYGFEFDEQVQDGDTLVENLGVKLLVDPMSLQYLSGAEIDYREGLEGAQFVIRNPNATTTCGWIVVRSLIGGNGYSLFAWHARTVEPPRNCLRPSI